MRIVIFIAFILIVGSLASALFFMMRDRGRTPNMMRSLMFRVGFSVALFLFILFSHWMGWIQSTGIRMGP
ncbi:twin transmembrane helix small protein [Cupriavidus sp. 30B13]|uniref:twin transmembrane helix small protein n=1 Tax=Cupriavidus sp. 30B13 TaxID=3384241 RepID=UPI003B8EC14C